MSADITLRKGLTIPISGTADLNISSADSADNFVIYPHDFHGVVPRMLLREGEVMLQGQPIFYSKANPEIKFVSPVSGTLTKIERGAKRRIMSLSISSDGKNEAFTHNLENLDKLEAADVKKHLLESGCWPLVKQRPYDVIADPDSTPKAIFISGFSTAPLAADVPFILSSQKEDFQTGINALAKLAPKVHLSVDASSTSFMTEVSNAEIHRVKGQHPAGNVGVQIHHIDPVNAGETVWVVGPADVARIGIFFSTGIFDASQMIAVVGPVVKSPSYFKSRIGAAVTPLLKKAGINAAGQIRVINGDSLSGTATNADGNLGYYNNTLTVLVEGNRYRMFGWLPFAGSKIFSMSRTSLSWILPKRTYALDTNMNGEERALVVTGEMEQVLPMDIFPMQLIKACMVQNIEKMEGLGIYEVAPEDFALVDYASSSKIEAQAIIREALDLMIKEVG
ncbi:MAG: NADH:ubiquinone reductase (Na(+)-transporting) subunit A [Flavobacteriaceae bacterium]|nr:NADH:ubiquinone reductase (Na(+)-transporting) subunit A [Flavobacteriaceae bacterium]